MWTARAADVAMAAGADAAVVSAVSSHVGIAVGNEATLTWGLYENASVLNAVMDVAGAAAVGVVRECVVDINITADTETAIAETRDDIYAAASAAAVGVAIPRGVDILFKFDDDTGKSLDLADSSDGLYESNDDSGVEGGITNSCGVNVSTTPSR